MTGQETINFSKTGAWPFVISGFWEGFSPCAFSILVFFAASLVFLSFGKKEKKVFGALFIFAALGTLCLIEAGFFESFRSLELFSVMSQAAYIFLGVFSIVLGMLSMRDWWMCQKGEGSEKSFLKISGILGGGEDSRMGSSLYRLGFFAILFGFLAAFFQSVCRGQVYFSMMLYFFGAEHQKIKAIFYIIVYNLFSVVPLILVFWIVFRAATDNRWKEYIRAHFSAVKIISAAVFFGLGFGLLFMFVS